MNEEEWRRIKLLVSICPYIPGTARDSVSFFLEGHIKEEVE